MKINDLFRLICRLSLIVFLGSLPVSASAEIIDDMTVRADANGEVDLVVKFAFQIQYLRNFPEGKTDYTAIYFNPLSSVPVSDWQNYESHRSPPSELIQDVSITTIDRTSGPTVQLKLKHASDISVSLGKNAQSLVIHIKPEILPAAALSIVAPSPAPSGDVTAPIVAPSSVAQKTVHIALGGLDGLPIFPDIDLPVTPLPEQSVSDQPAATPLTLAEQISKANNQAAPLMIKGGNAMLASQAFVAIDSFNTILKLPTNKYTEDAQLWVGVSREKTGQLPKAILEYNAYLKLYPNGRWAPWVKDRLAIFKASQPGLFVVAPAVAFVAPRAANTEFQYSAFGSVSLEGYLGASQTNTSATPGQLQAPTSFSAITQKSLIGNMSVTSRSYNNEYDNRLVFQDFYSANYLPGQANTNRLGAAFYEMKDRVDSYSVRIGRQSGMGGGVMGRFDGISAGYGINADYKVNLVAGQLSDVSLDTQPAFMGVGLDFGMKDRLGGTVYYIDQTINGFTDRRAIGGNLRYFEPAFNIMSMYDFDLLFNELNMLTVQGTINGGGKDNDYNFLLDRRKSPILDLRNALNGTTSTLSTLVQNGMTASDIITLADQRTTVSNSASLGMTNHLSENWNAGSDVFYSITDALAQSGSDPALLGGVPSYEGFVPASPSSGPNWSFSERLTGMGLFQTRDIYQCDLDLYSPNCKHEY